MNDKEKEKLSLAMYDIVVSIKDNVTLPTHTTMLLGRDALYA